MYMGMLHAGSNKDTPVSVLHYIVELVCICDTVCCGCVLLSYDVCDAPLVLIHGWVLYRASAFTSCV